MSARLSSRASTTRFAPSSKAALAAAQLVMPAWVERWTSAPGACCFTSAKTPRSATIKASAPAAHASRMAAGSRSRSRFVGRVFSVKMCIRDSRCIPSSFSHGIPVYLC